MIQFNSSSTFPFSKIAVVCYVSVNIYLFIECQQSNIIFKKKTFTYFDNTKKLVDVIPYYASINQVSLKGGF